MYWWLHLFDNKNSYYLGDRFSTERIVILRLRITIQCRVPPLHDCLIRVTFSYVQPDQINMAVFFWYLQSSVLTLLYTCALYKSFKGYTRNTRPSTNSHPVVAGFIKIKREKKLQSALYWLYNVRLISGLEHYFSLGTQYDGLVSWKV